MEHEQHPTGPTFDTLKAAEALQQAGFTGVQAKAVTRTIVEVQDNLASKADLRELRAETKAEFKTLRAEMKAEFKELRADNKRVEETLRAEIQGLKDSISTLRWLVVLVMLPLALGVAANLIGAVVGRFFLNG